MQSESLLLQLKEGTTSVIVDGNLITSRQPSDLPAFMREIIRIIKKDKG